MPYLRLLEQLLASVPGSMAALLLDPSGEIVVDTGPGLDKERHRLIGAYQGIALDAARKATARYDVGPIDCLAYRYATGSVVLRPLRDGYYLVFALSPEANLGRGIHFSAVAKVDLDAEL